MADERRMTADDSSARPTDEELHDWLQGLLGTDDTMRYTATRTIAAVIAEQGERIDALEAAVKKLTEGES